MGLVRVFIALAIPEDVRDALGRVQDHLRPAGADVSWVRPASIHATLRFIGDTNEERVPAIADAVAVAAAGIAPFEVEAKGTGYFPHEKRPRVVWIGLTGDLPPLLRLQARVEQAVVEVGYPEETRPFAPHLTLGRVKSAKRIDDLVRAARDVAEESCGAWAVDRVILYRSELRPRGAVYSRLAESPLIGS